MMEVRWSRNRGHGWKEVEFWGDLLEKIIKYEPEKRVTIYEVVRHLGLGTVLFFSNYWYGIAIYILSISGYQEKPLYSPT